MTDPSKNTDAPKPTGEKKTGNAQGGADSSGAGNILGGVQPEDGDESSERRDSGD